MPVFDLNRSMERAAARLGVRKGAAGVQRRSDANRSRLPKWVADELRALLLGQERPPMREVLQQLREACDREGVAAPARATAYNFLARTRAHEYRADLLPESVRGSLYNLADDAVVPGHQLVFYCFNYGDLAALSFAAGLPWLDLYQAARMRGWRPKSLALLRAAMSVRGI